MTGVCTLITTCSVTLYIDVYIPIYRGEDGGGEKRCNNLERDGSTKEQLQCKKQCKKQYIWTLHSTLSPPWRYLNTIPPMHESMSNHVSSPCPKQCVMRYTKSPTPSPTVPIPVAWQHSSLPCGLHAFRVLNVAGQGVEHKAENRGILGSEK